MREQLWSALDDLQRARAIELGTELYAKYGDTGAKPRLERSLRQGRARKTGTRTGSGTVRRRELAAAGVLAGRDAAWLQGTVTVAPIERAEGLGQGRGDGPRAR